MPMSTQDGQEQKTYYGVIIKSVMQRNYPKTPVVGPSNGKIGRRIMTCRERDLRTVLSHVACRAPSVLLKGGGGITIRRRTNNNNNNLATEFPLPPNSPPPPSHKKIVKSVRFAADTLHLDGPSSGMDSKAYRAWIKGEKRQKERSGITWMQRKFPCAQCCASSRLCQHDNLFIAWPVPENDGSGTGTSTSTKGGDMVWMSSFLVLYDHVRTSWAAQEITDVVPWHEPAPSPPLTANQALGREFLTSYVNLLYLLDKMRLMMRKKVTDLICDLTYKLVDVHRSADDMRERMVEMVSHLQKEAGEGPSAREYGRYLRMAASRGTFRVAETMCILPERHDGGENLENGPGPRDMAQVSWCFNGAALDAVFDVYKELRAVIRCLGEKQRLAARELENLADIQTRLPQYKATGKLVVCPGRLEMLKRIFDGNARTMASFTDRTIRDQMVLERSAKFGSPAAHDIGRISIRNLVEAIEEGERGLDKIGYTICVYRLRCRALSEMRHQSHWLQVELAANKYYSVGEE